MHLETVPGDLQVYKLDYFLAVSQKKKSVNMKLLFGLLLICFVGTWARKGTFPVVSRALPIKLDWRKKIGPAFPAIEYQGSVCGSCWAFATVATVEMLYALRRKEAVKLSKQELIDCMPTNQGNGCNYGLPPDAYKYIKQMGVHTEMDYPYRGVGNQQCNRSNLTSKKSFFIDDVFTRINLSDLQIMEFLQQGPGVVAIRLNDDFKNYYNGPNGFLRLPPDTTPYPPSVSELKNYHVVALIGWGFQNNTPYWIIMNSWGTSWGTYGGFGFLERTPNAISFGYFGRPILN